MDEFCQQTAIHIHIIWHQAYINPPRKRREKKKVKYDLSDYDYDAQKSKSFGIKSIAHIRMHDEARAKVIKNYWFAVPEIKDEERKNINSNI